MAWQPCARRPSEGNRPRALLQVAVVLRESLAAQAHPFDHDTCHRYLRIAQQYHGEAAWTTAWEAGRAMSLEQAIAYALEETKDA